MEQRTWQKIYVPNVLASSPTVDFELSGRMKRGAQRTIHHQKTFLRPNSFPCGYWYSLQAPNFVRQYGLRIHPMTLAVVVSAIKGPQYLLLKVFEDADASRMQCKVARLDLILILQPCVRRARQLLRHSSAVILRQSVE